MLEKTKDEIKILQAGGQILAQILHDLGKKVAVGMTGQELDKLAEAWILKAGGQPSFKKYNNFPNSLCVSVNQTVVHGIPSQQPFKEGDLIGLDLGMKYKDLYTDAAITVPVGKISAEAEKLLAVTKQALAIGVSQVGPNNHIGDIGQEIEKYVKPFGFGIVRALAGHGVGREVHEDPFIPNYDPGKPLDKMFPGLILAIEPMITLGSGDVQLNKNAWNVETKDQSLTAHFEHTVAVTEDGHLIITELDHGK